jgi:hypothetical protein
MRRRILNDRMCSTPFGITEVGTEASYACVRSLFRAQRLSASLRWALPYRETNHQADPAIPLDGQPLPPRRRLAVFVLGLPELEPDTTISEVRI